MLNAKIGAHHALLQGDRVLPKLIDSLTEALLEVSGLHQRWSSLFIITHTCPIHISL